MNYYTLKVLNIYKKSSYLIKVIFVNLCKNKDIISKTIGMIVFILSIYAKINWNIHIKYILV